MTRKDTNLDLLMAQKGIMSITELADKIGMKQQTLHSAIRKQISFKTAQKLADFFGCDIKEFIK